MSTDLSGLVLLRCGAQTYEWGKPASRSLVAELVGRQDDDQKRYAELWIGTHRSMPAMVANGSGGGGSEEATCALLEAALKQNPQAAFGERHTATWGSDVPFLLKVLSIDKALSVQAHPTREHAVQLHAADPEHYRDPNHKPELVVALTPFKAMCCFRPIAEIQHFLETIPALADLLGEDAVAAVQAVDPTERQPREALQRALRSLYAQPDERVRAALAAHATSTTTTAVPQPDGAAADSSAPQKGDAHEAFLEILEQFPNDVGCFAVYLLNVVRLQPGEGLFLAPNEPHSYLAGDCVEIMAASDNVVRAGLTPKFKDVEVLVNMLTYRTDALKDVAYAVDRQAAVQAYYPPAWCADFGLRAIRLVRDAGRSAEVTITDVPSIALGVVVRGSVSINGSAVLTKGASFALPAAAAGSGIHVTLAEGEASAEVFIASTRPTN